MKAVYFAIAAVMAAGFAAVGKPLDNASLEQKMDRLYAQTKAKYFSEKTSQFYCVEPAKVPSPADIKKFLPLKKNGKTNWHGGGSGMEDNTLFNGTMLAALCDKYFVDKSPATAAEARAVFKGLCVNATAHGDAGFVARGVSPADGKTVYPGTSIDQYTYLIFGMWRYFRSPMSTDAEKRTIVKILTQIADKMEREATPDAVPPNSFKFYKGMPDDRGTGRVIFDTPRIGGQRLPMFYGAAWDVSKNPKYKALWKKHLTDELVSIVLELNLAENMKPHPTYVIIQQMSALRLLYEIEDDPARREKLGKSLDTMASAYDVNKLFKPDFFVKKHNSPRDCAEMINGQLYAPNYDFSPERRAFFMRYAERLQGWYAGSFYPMFGAYWRARALGFFKP